MGAIPLIVFVALLGIVWPSKAEAPKRLVNNCSQNHVQNCTAGLTNMYGFQEETFVKNASEVKEMCRHTQDAFQCIHSYVERCLDTLHQALYHDMTGGLQKFILDFCDEDSEFSKEYRRHSLECYNELLTEYKDCSKYITSAQSQINYDKQLSSNDAARLICCAYEQTLSCYRDVTRSRCSEEAAHFVDTIFAKLLGNAMGMLSCERLVYDGPQCRSTASRTIAASRNLAAGIAGRLSFVFIAAFAASFWKCRMTRRDPYAVSPSDEV